MNLFITKDGAHYRKWINVVINLFVPGSAQFVSGRKRAGVVWISVALALGLCMLLMLFSLNSSYSIRQPHWFDAVNWVFLLALVIDGCRKPLPRMKGSRWMILLGVWLAFVVLPPLVARQFFVRPFNVPAVSMSPTIRGVEIDIAGNINDGDCILVNLAAYWTKPPQRGNIVVFSTEGIENPYVRKSTHYIKRIVGIPGDTVSIDPPQLVINGSPITEPDIFATIAGGQNGYNGFTLAHNGGAEKALLSSPDDSVTLGENEYFVLGDNTVDSLDSRYFGAISGSSIIGKVFYVYAPAERKRWIR